MSQQSIERQAWQAIETATSNGLLFRLSCEKCGSCKAVEAHHPDYAKPLDVQWLCRSCHKKEHAKDRVKPAPKPRPTKAEPLKLPRGFRKPVRLSESIARYVEALAPGDPFKATELAERFGRTRPAIEYHLRVNPLVRKSGTKPGTWVKRKP